MGHRTLGPSISEPFDIGTLDPLDLSAFEHLSIRPLDFAPMKYEMEMWIPERYTEN